MAFGFQEAQGDVALVLTAAAATVNSGPIGGAGSTAYALCMVHVTAITGTTPTLVVSLEESADGSSSWTAVTGATTASITAAGSAVFFGKVVKNYVRALATIGGTTPAVTGTVAVITFAE
jgi:hypothetical protein